MENSTGKFLSGENVPTGMRPTVFWEHQQISPKFDYNTYIEKKDLRIASHKKNLENYQKLQEKLEKENKELQNQIAILDIQVGDANSNYVKAKPTWKELE